MIEALLLFAAEPAMTAIDVERAFAAEAQKAGQWTAFRTYAADDATLFTPQATKAREFLKDRGDPAVAVFWWPGRSYVSCDGGTAVNTGPWVRFGGKSVGYFTTVWQRQADGGWKWVMDHGDRLASLRPEGGDIEPVVAACGADGPPPPQPPALVANAIGGGRSNDGSLTWDWTVFPDGSRVFRAHLWDGKRWTMVIDDRVAAE